MTIIKIGGAIIGKNGAPPAFWQAIRTLQKTEPVVLLHGGAAYATEVARRLGHTPHIVQGRRITTDLDLEIVQWTLRGAMNARLVAQAWGYGIPAVGLSGIDDGLIQVTKRPPRKIDEEWVDFGWVGEVQSARVDILKILLEAGRLPIMAPLGIDEVGQIYNVNADTVAVSVATALHANRLMLVAEAGGVYRDLNKPASRLVTCTKRHFEAGYREGWIVGGMRVKLTVAFQALAAGLSEVFILKPEDLLHPEKGTRVAIS